MNLFIDKFSNGAYLPRADGEMRRRRVLATAPRSRNELKTHKEKPNDQPS